MKLSTKAAIYSGLVFPGAGYFIVKRTIRGALSFLVTFAALAVIMTEVFHKAQIIADKIVIGAIPPDPLLRREQILETPGVLSPEMVSTISIAIGVVWLVALVDSWRIGRSLPEED